MGFWGSARTIVGVVGNERFHGIAEPPPIAVYLPLTQAPSRTGGGVLLARGAGEPAAFASLLRNAIREQDPGLAVFGVEALTETVSRSVAEQRFTMLVLGVFAAVALLLAAVGIYGVLSYAVSQRTVELGIRMALGARAGELLWLVVGRGLVLALTGVGIGLLGAWIVTRLLESLLFGVTPTDPAVYAIVSIGLIIVAVLASYLPARRGLIPSRRCGLNSRTPSREKASVRRYFPDEEPGDRAESRVT